MNILYLGDLTLLPICEQESKYKQNNCEELNYEDSFFDEVICFQLPLKSEFIYWSLQEIHRVLKDEGKLKLIGLNPLSITKIQFPKWLLLKILNKILHYFDKLHNLNDKYVLFKSALENKTALPSRLYNDLNALFFKNIRATYTPDLHPSSISQEGHSSILQLINKYSKKYYIIEATRTSRVLNIKDDPLFQDKENHIKRVKQSLHALFLNLEQWKRNNNIDPKQETNLQEIITQNDKALILSPHPDDEIIGCGGTILQMLKQNIQTTVLQITDGSGAKALKGKSSELNHNARVTEAIEVAKYIQLKDLVLWKLSPEALLPNTKLVNKLKELLVSRKPTLIFTPFINDPHPDHISTNLILAKALMELPSISISANIFCYEVWSLVPLNSYALISDFFNIKCSALYKYRWAMRAGDYISKCKDINSYHHFKLKNVAGYAEAFYCCNAETYLQLMRGKIHGN
ncbi:MAG: PIG-L family deacetylase [Proteobacteria bacterium]|nr:PIG-L family deacetylase [Pseudomonadota bacterium]